MKRYGLLGEKLGHSFSPQIHSVFGDYEYKLFPVAPDEIETFFAKREFDGINVTIPYKQTVIPYCQFISPIAERLHSVNTITVLPNGALYGDNTDYQGFLVMLQKANISVKGKKVLVLGNGGSSHTACAVCEDEGASVVVVISRSGKDNYDNLHLHSDANILINTTPVGMYPNNGKSPVNLSDFPNCEAVADLIYNPQKTALLLQAEKIGLNYVNGMTMLVAQASVSSEQFTGIRIEDSMVEKAVKTVSSSMQNIVLIGMPGCGKSTIGKVLSKILNKHFFDSDEIITKLFEKSPSVIIKTEGEASFREKESNVIFETGKTTASIISTGGGVILNEKNMENLRQNGNIIFIDRSLDQLETSGRPLSNGVNALQSLYEYRIPLYKKYADYIVNGNGSIHETVNQILNYLNI